MRKTCVYPAIVTALLALAMNAAQADRLRDTQPHLSIGSQSTGAGAGKIRFNDLTGSHELNPQPLPPGLRHPRWF
jgi:hypothetical protein